MTSFVRTGRPGQPHVGLFWGVGDQGRLQLVTATTPLAEAEAYGAALTDPRGHFEVWEGWRALGATGLRRAGLPTAIAGHEYEHFPRGRVVYHTEPEVFTIYADRRLQRSAIIDRITQASGLVSRPFVVRSDPHYRTLPL